jgi:hypothetical protein
MGGSRDGDARKGMAVVVVAVTMMEQRRLKMV